MKYIKKYWIIIAIIATIVFLLSAIIKPAFCFLILGSIFFYISFDSILFLKKLQDKGIGCHGRILSFKSDNEGFKFPIVEFTTTEGVYITDTPRVCFSSSVSQISSYKEMIGDPVSILYDPGNPKSFIIADDTGSNYFGNAVFILIGLAAIILSICSFLGYVDI